MPHRTSRPRLALPYTVVAEPDAVRLVAGEDHRYTLSGPGLEAWLPGLLIGCDGRRSLEELLAGLDEVARPGARDLIGRLYGERVLVDGPAELAHVPVRHAIVAEGTGALADRLAELGTRAEPGVPVLPVFCQDRLDYAAALMFNRRCLQTGVLWLWATLGPMGRGYVSPPFLPAAGPCWACLLGHFRRLSPAPELYDALIDHARRGGSIEPVPFPATGVEILSQLVLWKGEQLARSEPPSALYRLHVLELETMEVTSHRVPIDPECPECGDGGDDVGRMG
ncbi:MAG: TOMM precursor leader peptide-binding protein [Isosphaeraceae bacterium]